MDAGAKIRCRPARCPCSGTGTLRRHPDIAWLKDEEDVSRLTLAQDRLLLPRARAAEARRDLDLCGVLARGGRRAGARSEGLHRPRLPREARPR
jgi:hypothetical protein